ncbi:MAG TPA: hypothetical protein VK509_01495, partial [Polyangiales bacterium]|nr:hypothetical protein [Polyangiales bacterium]
MNAPRAAFDAYQRVLTSYAGALHTVRKTSGGDVVSTFDVPYDAASGLMDSVARAAFVGAQSWAWTRLHDQAAGGRHITQGTTGNQPDGGITGTQFSLNGRAAADFIPAGSHRLSRADALGLSGGVALTMFAEIKADTLAAVRFPCGLGNSGVARNDFSVGFVDPTIIFITIGGS